MIALAAIVGFLSFTNIGSGFSDRQAKSEAQKIMNTAAEIQAAYEANRAMNNNRDFTDYNHLLNSLTSESKLLRDRVINDYHENFNALSFEGEGQGTLILTQDDERVCRYINHQIHNVPLDTEILSCGNSAALTCCEN